MTAPATPADEREKAIEWCERQAQLLDYAEFMKDGTERDRALHERQRFKLIAALLSSPSVESVRREALEEAAEIAEGYVRDLSNPIFARACAENIAAKIRALTALPGEDKQARG